MCTVFCECIHPQLLNIIPSPHHFNTKSAPCLCVFLCVHIDDPHRAFPRTPRVSSVFGLCRCFSLINFFSSSGKPFDRPYNFTKNAKFINGLTEYELRISENIALEKSNVFRRTASQDGHVTQLDFENLRPGTVVAIR